LNGVAGGEAKQSGSGEKRGEFAGHVATPKRLSRSQKSGAPFNERRAAVTVPSCELFS